jgi:hypothetical protein
MQVTLIITLLTSISRPIAFLTATSPYTAQAPENGSRSSTPTQNGDEARPHQATGSETQVAQRSRWQAVLLEAGGLSAALSEESMRRLKYCLQWLQVGPPTLIVSYPILLTPTSVRRCAH